MSWNEPGGNKKDPWSGRDQQETPPDLEEVMRSLQDKLGRLFGNGSAGNGGGNAKKTLGVIAAIPLAIWALTGVYIVDQGNRAVVTRFGKYVDTTQPGPHWRLPAPIENHTIINVEQQRFIEVGYRSNGRQQTPTSVAKEALMLTEDVNIVDIRLAVQYQIKDARSYLFNLLDPDITLKQITESVERGIVGKSSMNDVLTKDQSNIAEGTKTDRTVIADEIKKEIQQILDSYQAGIQVTSINFVDAQTPEEVRNAFEDALKAQEDEQRLRNEAEAYRNEVLNKVQGAQARLKEEAEAYKLKLIAKAKGEAGRFDQLLTEYHKAPEVTRERLYLETMESVLEKTNTVLLDVKNGNNLVYLPIDKLHKPAPLAESAKDVDNAPVVKEIPDSIAKNIRSGSTRGREGRTQ
ncbi:MAG: FtsH protease activity modulator HflK [Methylococcaceae bacterium]|nr:FtsH protease activity modulator HflK [Methylococcaceae bacterium]